MSICPSVGAWAASVAGTLYVRHTGAAQQRPLVGRLLVAGVRGPPAQRLVAVGWQWVGEELVTAEVPSLGGGAGRWRVPPASSVAFCITRSDLPS